MSWPRFWKDRKKNESHTREGWGRTGSDQCESKGTETGINVRRLKEGLQAQSRKSLFDSKNTQCLPYVGHCADNK